MGSKGIVEAAKDVKHGLNSDSLGIFVFPLPNIQHPRLTCCAVHVLLGVGDMDSLFRTQLP